MKKEIISAVLGIAVSFNASVAFMTIDQDWSQLDHQQEQVVHTGLQDLETSYHSSDRFRVNNFKGKKGLNLLLLNNLQNESYLKELLTIYADYADGRLTDPKYVNHLSLGGVLGFSIAETGFYDSERILPKSYLPYDSTNHEVVWNKPYKQFSAEDMHLYKVNYMMVNTSYADSDSNKISYSINGLGKPPSESGERDIGPFQIEKTSFGVYGADSKHELTCPILAGYQESASATRISDPFFLPDMLQYFDKKMEGMLNCFKPDIAKSLDQKLIDLMFSKYHNGGSGAFAQGTFGMDSAPSVEIFKEHSEEAVFTNQYVADMFEQLRTVNQQEKLIELLCTPNNPKILAACLSAKNGFIFSTRAYNNLFADAPLPGVPKGQMSVKSKKTAYIYSIIDNKGYKSESEVPDTYVKEVQEIFKSRVIDPVSEGYNSRGGGYTMNSMNSNTWGTLMKVHKDKKTTIYGGSSDNLAFTYNLVNAGHMLTTYLAGDYQYARMLKYAGVDVDPTRPDTYFSKYDTDGEWTPSGGVMQAVSFLTSYGINSATLSEKRIKLLIFANHFNDNNHPYWLGGYATILNENTYETLYSWWDEGGGTNEQNAPMVFARDSNGKLKYEGIRLFDCASFTDFCFRNAVNLPLDPSGAKACISNDKKTTALTNRADALPGDICHIKGHIGIILKYDSANNIVTLIEATPDFVQIMSHSLNKNNAWGKAVFYRPIIDNY